MPARTRSAPSLLHRLGDEIRAVCRQVANRAPASPGTAAAHPLGEWLGSVRQPGGEFAALRHAPRSTRALERAESRGDLTRTRVTRIKRDRGSLYDAVTRDRGF